MARPELTRIVARRIRRLRSERGWSARELAQRCGDLGMPSLTRSTIAKIESGLRGLDVQEVAVLAGALGVTVEQLTADSAVTVLHLSDLRFAPDQAFGFSDDTPSLHDTLLQALCDDLDLLARTVPGGRPDLIVVSGDLAVTGRLREFDLVKTFLEGLATHLGLDFGRIAIVPGNHDVNIAASRGYLAQCEADDIEPQKPYWHNWKHFATLFGSWPDAGRLVRMQAEQPWSLFDIKDLRVVVAGLNSTVDTEPDRPPRPGLVGAEQAGRIAAELAEFEQQGWLRIGVVHHHPLSGAEAPHENLDDAAILDEHLGTRLNLLLHGHASSALEQGRLGSGLLTLGTGSPATASPERAAANRYQLVRITADGLVRLSRRLDLRQRRWLVDGGAERADWSRPVSMVWPAADDTFPMSPVHRVTMMREDAWEPAGSAWGTLDPRRLLLDQVADVCVAQHANAVVHRIKSRPPYLRVTYVDEGHTRQLRVGGCVGEVSEADVDAFLARVHGADYDVESVLVYQGTEPSKTLRDYALRRNVRLRSFLQFQGLLDLNDYVQGQTERLLADVRYPPAGYVTQRFTDVTRPGGEVRTDVVEELLRLVRADEGRFTLLLGDFGCGKTFALRELARRIPLELPHLTPIFIDLRALDKANTLEGHVAAHLANHGHDDIDLRAFRYMLKHGRIVLIFDGFDELVARATYERAADHLQTLLAAAQDQAKIVVASRTQHFQAHSQVLTAMGLQVGRLPQRRILSLTDLSHEQIRTLLVRRYSGTRGEVDRRLALLADIPGLMELARNPRMLGFIADLDEARLRAVSTTRGTISPAGLYEEIIDAWLSHEEERTQAIPGAPVGLSATELRAAVTVLALRIWQHDDALIGIDELGDVALTLTDLAGGHLSAEQIAHAVGAGSLLVRTEGGLFGFIHESVMEWLVAKHIADGFTVDGTDRQPLLERRPLSHLTVEFLCGLADTARCRAWANAVRTDPAAGAAVQTNASRILARLSSSARLDLRAALLGGEELADRSWPEADLTDADLTGARLANMSLTGAVLRGARLVGTALDDVDLTGADLTGADLTRARISRSNLTGANLTGAAFSDARLMGSDLSDTVADGAVWRRTALVSVTASPALLSAAARGGAAVLPGQPVETAIMPAAVGVLFGFEEGRLPRPLAYDAEGALLAIGSEDGSVLVCDANDGRPLRMLVGHRWRTYAVMFSPTAPLLATGSQDGTVRLWDANTGVCRHVLPEHPGWVWPMLFNADGTLLVTGAKDGVLRIWDTATGELRWRLAGHKAPVWTASFSADGSSLATGDDGAIARIWDAGTGRLRHRLDTDGKLTYWIRFDPSGTRLAGGAEDGVIRIWETATGTLRHRLIGHRDAVYALDFHPGGQYIVSADVSGAVRRFDLPADGGPPVGRQLGKHTGAVYRITFSPRGTLFSTGDRDGVVRLWEAHTGEVRHELSGHHASVWPMMFRPDGDRLATSSNDFTTRVWDTRTGECLQVLRGHGRRMRSVNFSSDGSLLATSGNDGVVRLWDPRTGQCHRVLRRELDRLISVVFSSEPGLLATASNDGRVYLWDALTGTEGRHLEVSTDNVWATVFSPDGELIATANDDDTIQLLHRRTGRTITSLQGLIGRGRALAFSPDGRVLASGGDDQLVRLWDRKTEQPTVLPKAHTDRIFSISYHPNGHLLASAGHDGNVVLWDGAAGTVKRVLKAAPSKLWTVAFHPSGKFLATGGDEAVIDIWSTATGRRLHRLTGHTRRIWSVVYSPDGTMMASSSTDGTVRVWQVAGNGATTHGATLLGLPEGWAAFTPSGRHKASGEVSGHFWHAAGMSRFEPGELEPYLDEVRELDADSPLF